MNLLYRVLTASVLLPLVLFLVHLGSWPMFGLVTTATAIVLYEYFRMWAVGDRTMIATGIALGLLVGVTAMLAPESLGEAIVVAILATMLGFTLNPGPFETTFARMATTVLGIVYGGVTLSYLYRARMEPGTLVEGSGWVYLALTVTWANDTAAYFAGRFLGRHKLFPLISPKKTWEGAFGGVAGSIGGALIASVTFAPFLTLSEALLVGAIGGVLAPLGDLVESLLKRSFGSKDSGKLLPGHGGLLDRVDALMVTAPFVYLFLRFVHPLFS